MAVCRELGQGSENLFEGSKILQAVNVRFPQLYLGLP
jgi:hypothetical protein